MNAEPIIGSLLAAGLAVVSMAEPISVDPGTVMGGGGLTMGGFLLSVVWRYLKRQEKLQDLQEKLMEKRLDAIDAESRHRESERSHWRLVEGRLDRHGEVLRDIHDALRPPTGPHTPVHGIDIREPGEPEPLGGAGYRPPARPPQRR